MVYITKFRFDQIEFKIKIINNLKGLELYKDSISFLSMQEKEWLLKYMTFCKNPEESLKYYETHQEDSEDSKKYMHKLGKPAYHLYKKCSHLLSDFENNEIPKFISEKGEDEILRFKKWWGLNGHFLENKPDLLEEKMRNEFGYAILPESVHKVNSGVQDFDNIDLKELENEIDEIIKKESYFYKNPKIPSKYKEAIKEYKHKTYLYKKVEFTNIFKYKDEELNNKELKDLLKRYDENYKKPIKEKLQTYFRIRFNPDMKFEGTLLDQIGFKKCNVCFHENFKKEK